MGALLRADVTHPRRGKKGLKMTGKRITLSLGKKRHIMIVTEAPFPEVGDACTIAGKDWSVISVKDEKILAVFNADEGKLKQVFP